MKTRSIPKSVTSKPMIERMKAGICTRADCGKPLAETSRYYCEHHRVETNKTAKGSSSLSKIRNGDKKLKVTPVDHYKFAVQTALSRGEIGELIKLIKSEINKEYNKIAAAKELLEGKGQG